MFIRGLPVDHRRVAAEAKRTVAEVARFTGRVRSALEHVTRSYTVYEQGLAKTLSVTRLGVGPLLTPAGKFWLMPFEVDDEWHRYDALVAADLDEESLMPLFDKDCPVVVRPDSGCSTGQLFGDRTCDCLGQLQLTLEKISQAGQGLIIHIPAQDGRGKGLAFKLGTLWLQDEFGVNTVESASMLAGQDFIDVRTYGGVIAILKFLGLSPSPGGPSWRLSLATNNPEKERVFVENGYLLAERQPVAVPPTEHTLGHLQAKKELLGHDSLLT